MQEIRNDGNKVSYNGTMFVQSFWLTRLKSINGETHSTVNSKTNLFSFYEGSK
jgi:hypothetical protein